MIVGNDIFITESTIENWLKHWRSSWDEKLYGITMIYIYIYIDTIKGGRDTALEAEAQLYSDNITRIV